MPSLSDSNIITDPTRPGVQRVVSGEAQEDVSLGSATNTVTSAVANQSKKTPTLNSVYKLFVNADKLDAPALLPDPSSPLQRGTAIPYLRALSSSVDYNKPPDQVSYQLLPLTPSPDTWFQKALKKTASTGGTFLSFLSTPGNMFNKSVDGYTAMLRRSKYLDDYNSQRYEKRAMELGAGAPYLNPVEPLKALEPYTGEEPAEPTQPVEPDENQYTTRKDTDGNPIGHLTFRFVDVKEPDADYNFYHKFGKDHNPIKSTGYIEIGIPGHPGLIRLADEEMSEGSYLLSGFHNKNHLSRAAYNITDLSRRLYTDEELERLNSISDMVPPADASPEELETFNARKRIAFADAYSDIAKRVKKENLSTANISRYTGLSADLLNPYHYATGALVGKGFKLLYKLGKRGVHRLFQSADDVAFEAERAKAAAEMASQGAPGSPHSVDLFDLSDDTAFVVSPSSRLNSNILHNFSNFRNNPKLFEAWYLGYADDMSKPGSAGFLGYLAPEVDKSLFYDMDNCLRGAGSESLSKFGLSNRAASSLINSGYTRKPFYKFARDLRYKLSHELSKNPGAYSHSQSLRYYQDIDLMLYEMRTRAQFELPLQYCINKGAVNPKNVVYLSEVPEANQFITDLFDEMRFIVGSDTELGKAVEIYKNSFLNTKILKNDVSPFLKSLKSYKTFSPVVEKFLTVPRFLSRLSLLSPHNGIRNTVSGIVQSYGQPGLSANENYLNTLRGLATFRDLYKSGGVNDFYRDFNFTNPANNYAIKEGADIFAHTISTRYGNNPNIRDAFKYSNLFSTPPLALQYERSSPSLMYRALRLYGLSEDIARKLSILNYMNQGMDFAHAFNYTTKRLVDYSRYPWWWKAVDAFAPFNRFRIGSAINHAELAFTNPRYSLAPYYLKRFNSTPGYQYAEGALPYDTTYSLAPSTYALSDIDYYSNSTTSHIDEDGKTSRAIGLSAFFPQAEYSPFNPETYKGTFIPLVQFAGLIRCIANKDPLNGFEDFTTPGYDHVKTRWGSPFPVSPQANDRIMALVMSFPALDKAYNLFLSAFPEVAKKIGAHPKDMASSFLSFLGVPSNEYSRDSLLRLASYRVKSSLLDAYKTYEKLRTSGASIDELRPYSDQMVRSYHIVNLLNQRRLLNKLIYTTPASSLVTMPGVVMPTQSRILHRIKEEVDKAQGLLDAKGNYTPVFPILANYGTLFHAAISDRDSSLLLPDSIREIVGRTKKLLYENLPDYVRYYHDFDEEYEYPLVLKDADGTPLISGFADCVIKYNTEGGKVANLVDFKTGDYMVPYKPEPYRDQSYLTYPKDASIVNQGQMIAYAAALFQEDPDLQMINMSVFQGFSNENYKPVYETITREELLDPKSNSVYRKALNYLTHLSALRAKRSETLRSIYDKKSETLSAEKYEGGVEDLVERIDSLILYLLSPRPLAPVK